MLPSEKPHDPFDVFDPWSEPVLEPMLPPPTVPERTRVPGMEAPTPPRPSETPVRPQPMPVPRTPAGGARFSSTGALEPGVVVSAAPAEAKRPRWSESRPTRAAVTPPAPPPDPATNPTDFLRRVVVPEFQGLARRLEASQHYTSVQDLLDLPQPAVRVLIWPRPGLLDQAASRILATFELMLNRAASPRVTTSYWLGARPEHVIPMAEVPVARLELAWVENQVLDFVQKVLDRI